MKYFDYHTIEDERVHYTPLKLTLLCLLLTSIFGSLPILLGICIGSYDPVICDVNNITGICSIVYHNITHPTNICTSPQPGFFSNNILVSGHHLQTNINNIFFNGCLPYTLSVIIIYGGLFSLVIALTFSMGPYCCYEQYK